MSIIDNILQKKEQEIEKKVENRIRKQYDKKFSSLVETLSEKKEKESDFIESQWRTIGAESFGIYNNPKTNAFLKEFTEWVYANVNVIAEAVSNIEIKLMKYVKNDVVEVQEHPILELLYKANPYMTKKSLFYFIDSNLSLTGEAPIRLKRNNPKDINELPSELWPLNPSEVVIKIAEDKNKYEMITGYDYVYFSEGKQNKLSLNPWEVIFIKNPNPNNIWRGIGAVEASQRSIDILNHSESYNLNLFRNSAVPYMALYTDQRLNDAVIERLKRNWNAKYKGVEKTGNTAILEAGLKIEKIQQSAKDMDYIEQQKFIRDKLMAIFKTTPVVLGITENVNKAVAEASEYVFSKYCVKPRMQNIIDFLNEFLVPLFDKKGEYFLDFENPVKQDREAIVSEYKQAVDSWMTRNEIRTLEGLPPLEGGDEIFVPFNVIPLNGKTNIQDNSNNTETNQEEPVKSYRVLKPKFKNSNVVKYKEQIAKLKNRNLKIKQASKELSEQIRGFVKSYYEHNKKVEIPKVTYKYPKIKDKQFHSLETAEMYHKKLLSNTSEKEKEIEEKIQTLYDRQQKEVVSNISRVGTKYLLSGTKKYIKKQIEDKYMFDEEEYIAIAVGILTPILTDIIKIEGKEAASLIGIDEYNLQESARQWLAKKPLQASKSMNEYTYQKVRESLSEGVKNKESVEELTKRVNDIYGDLEKYKAKTVAVSESSRAMNFAAIDAFKQSGIVTKKIWTTAADERVCEYCGPMDGKVIGLEEKFFDKGDTLTGDLGGKIELDYEDIEGGSLHPNCRCTVFPEGFESKQFIEENQKSKLLDEIERELDESRRTKVKKA